MDEKILTQIAILLQRKYNEVCDVEKITQELEEALRRNDEVMVDIVLNMRLQAMSKAEEAQSGIDALLQPMSEQQQAPYRALMQMESDSKPQTHAEKTVREIYGKIHSVLKRTIVVDRVLNQKLCGSNSFYVGK